MYCLERKSVVEPHIKSCSKGEGLYRLEMVKKICALTAVPFYGICTWCVHMYVYFGTCKEVRGELGVDFFPPTI